MKRSLITLCCLVGSAAWSGPVQKLPAFHLRDLRGKQLSYRGAGKGFLVLNFFASWCTSCAGEIPILQKIRQDYPSATLIGVDVGEDAARAGRWVKKNEYPWPVVLDSDKTLTDKLGITSIPVTLIVDKQGRITYRGSRPPENLREELARAGQ